MGSSNGSGAADAYCPHCGLEVEREVGGDWPGEPRRCPHCRLLIGAGRARAEPSDDAGTKGAAAGVLSREARRGDDAGAGDERASAEDVLAAIGAAAESLGTRPERLLMVDYERLREHDSQLPALSDVFSHFRSWKRARRAAAERGAS